MLRSFPHVRGLGVRTLEVQTESWVGWRWGGKKNVLEVGAYKTKYLVMILKENGKGGACSTYGETRGAYMFLVWKIG